MKFIVHLRHEECVRELLAARRTRLTHILHHARAAVAEVVLARRYDGLLRADLRLADGAGFACGVDHLRL